MRGSGQERVLNGPRRSGGGSFKRVADKPKPKLTLIPLAEMGNWSDDDIRCEILTDQLNVDLPDGSTTESEVARRQSLADSPAQSQPRP
jgi:hypothetical protein